MGMFSVVAGDGEASDVHCFIYADAVNSKYYRLGGWVVGSGRFTQKFSHRRNGHDAALLEFGTCSMSFMSSPAPHHRTTIIPSV